MTPTPADLVGVTVGGEPLASVLARESAERKREEAEEAAEREVREKCRTIIRHHKAGPLPAETSRVSQRARHLTPDEIRKEYGIMQSPYATQIENVLYVIKGHPGGIDAEGIAKTLSVPKVKIQSVVSLVFRAVADKNVLSREMKSGKYFYRAVSPETKVEYMYDAYRAAKVWKKLKKDGKVNVVKPPADKPKMPLDDSPLRPWATLESTIEKEFGMKVEVSGRVDIVIRFER